MDNTHRGSRSNAVCQDVRHAAQKRDRCEVCFWAIGGIVETTVKCWGQSDYGCRKIGDDGIYDELQECLPDERSARRWGMRRHGVPWFLSPANHTWAVCEVEHPPELPRQWEIRW